LTFASAVSTIRPLRALLLDDRSDDAELLALELKRSGIQFEWRYACDEATFVAALDWPPDVILADYVLPNFSAPQALALVQARGLDIPFIVVTGSIGEEKAAGILKRGAADYLLKDRVGRIGPAVQRALNERDLRIEARLQAQRLKDAEERTRFALEATGVGTWEADLTTGALAWSATLEALHGLPAGSFSGTFAAFLATIHADDRAVVAETIEVATRDHKDAQILYRTVWPDGSLHWINGTGRTFYDAAGRPVRAAGVGTDVTERRLLEEQYRQSQKMEAIGQLAGGVAHDFNNLLTVIQGFAAMLAEDVPAVAQREELKQINLAATRATALTRQLLAFSRRQILDNAVFDVAQTLRDIEPMLRRLIGEQIQFEVKTPSAIAAIKGDRGQIEQVIMNLALNARDAMPSGGTLVCDVAAVSLSAAYAREHPETTPGRYVRLRVIDSGEGMSQALIARIFEPFFTTKGKEKGTGLGLSTVYGIVKQSGGHITVDSEPSRGTTFRVYLPAACGEVDAPRVSQVDPRSASSEAATILVVEDDVAIRELVSMVLLRHGFRVLLAAGPGEALEIAADPAASIDLLLSDVIMPGMSGKELADRIAAERLGLRVLYMSGYTDDAIARHGVLEQGLSLMQKPFTPDALHRKVREMLA
jgi:PAS domain S-box-containing protein